MLFLNRTQTLILYAVILHARSGAKIKLRTKRIVRYELNLARPKTRKVFQANLKRV